MPPGSYARASGSMTFGGLAVDGFFLLSGFLIAQSRDRDPEFLNCLRKRVLRTVPGYLVALLLSILVVGSVAPGVNHFFMHLDLARAVNTSIGCEVLRTEESCDRFEGTGPILVSVGRVGTESLDVDGEGKALLRASKVEEGRTQDAFEGRVRMVELVGQPGKPGETLFLLVKRYEDRTVAPEEIDVTAEAMGRLLVIQAELKL
jgi:hypothetical protein